MSFSMVVTCITVELHRNPSTAKVAHSFLSFTVKNSSTFVSIDNPFLFFLSVARRVAVPDERWDFLCDFHKPARYS